MPARINALDCPEPDEAILEKPVTLRCAVSPKLPIASVTLHYRTPGKDAYDQTEMTKTPKGWFQGKVPKKSVVGKSLQYWFEGKNADGKTVVQNGDSNGPNILLIVEEGQQGRAAGASPVGEDEENPLDEDGRPEEAPALSRAPRHRDRRARHPVRQTPVLGRHRCRNRFRLRQG